MLRPSPQHGHLADEEIIDDLTAVLVGAIEPATRAAGWILLTLARHPQAADQVAAEARTLPDDPHLVTRDHLDGLRYTQALVREVLRLYPPNWLLARRATQQTELAGFAVPPGTMVLVCPYTAHREAAEHREPEQFRPERWLDDNGSLTTPGTFLSFSTGPRACSGTAMALAELTLITAQTARRYHIAEPSGPAPSHHVTTFGALEPTGLRLRATPRA